MSAPAAAPKKEMDCLSPEAQKLAEARLAAKRAARAEAREIRMKELERQQKEVPRGLLIYQVQKKYYGLDTKWGDIEQWMEDSERCSRRSRRTASASDEDERMSVGSRGSLRSQPDMEYGRAPTWTNGYDAELCGAQSLSRRSGRGPSWSSLDPGLPAGGLAPRALSAYPGSRASVFDDSSLTRARRGSGGGSYAPSEYSGHLTSSSRASSRASSARASPVVEERPEKDFAEKGSRNMPGLSAATLASLGGTSSRRGSGDTSISLDTEASIREIKELNELKDQIQDVEGKYMQGLKEMKDSLAEVEEKYKKAMVSNAQLDNEKTNFMYQVDTLKDMLLELEEELAESRRQYEEKSKEFEREKHAHSVLQFQFADVKEALRQREAMLEEIRQLQQKQASSLREISDLQETIEWKDKKIGALERQKEFFDSIRSERDDLREEVVTLKEALKKHGIILNSEAATNGETPDPPNNVGHPTKEEMGALQSAGDGALGRAKEVEVENVGKREMLQNAERAQHKEDAVEDSVDREVLRPGESMEDRRAAEHGAPSLGALESAKDEEAQSPVVGSASSLGSPEQAAGSGPSLAASDCARDSGSGGPGTGSGLDIQSHSENSVETQEQEEPEDLENNSDGFGPKPCQEPVASQTSEVRRVSGADTVQPSGDHAESVAGAGVTHSRRAGTERSEEAQSPGDGCAADSPGELGPGTGRGPEGASATQEAVEPREGPAEGTGVSRGNSTEEEGEAETTGEAPTPPDGQPTPESPAAQSARQGAPGPQTARARSDPPDTKEPDEDQNDPQREAVESLQKKPKNKKKKNKKKKSPAAADTQPGTEEGPGAAAEEQGTCSSQAPAAEAQDAATESPEQTAVAGGGGHAECPGNPKTESDGKRSQEGDGVHAKAGDAVAKGDTFALGDDTVPSPGASGSDKESDGSVVNDDAKKNGAAQGRAPEPENGGGTDSVPSPDIADGSQMPQQPSQPAREALDSVSLEDDDPSASAGEGGDLSVESRVDGRAGSEKGRGKEDCALS
ncbi:leucine-rich repeat flightless-interacting protein 1 isoform X4 [Oryctolagus cuniculus]|uniref:leucine-rich repeat flightless-interacting protein 1 isoform X4 n=1 Tax=Oryctolagus cuniculus TaxID=9986 RepID=UPI00387A2EBB